MWEKEVTGVRKRDPGQDGLKGGRQGGMEGEGEGEGEVWESRSIDGGEV